MAIESGQVVPNFGVSSWVQGVPTTLRGTPSTLLVDREGVLRDISFGRRGHLDGMIQGILDED